MKPTRTNMLPTILPLSLKTSIISHLNDLDEDSKYLRFGYTPSADAITKYVDESFEHIDKSVWFGYIDKTMCVGAIHVAINKDGDIAELGISINPEYRGKKLSSQLFDRAIEYLKSKNITKVYMQCLSENTVIQYLARKYGMKVSNLGGGEKEANAELHVDNPIIHKMSGFTNECLGLVDACFRHNIWLYTSFNGIFTMFNTTQFFKE